MASLEEKQWPLDVFRRTARGVWEKMSVVTAAGNDEEDASSNQLDQKPIATGVPRKGCIVIKRFRLRIKLCSQNNVTTECVDGSQQEGSATTTNSEDTVAEIVRRGR